MDGNTHYYYLHTNGDLIHKLFEPEADSPFVKKVWILDTRDRGTAWRLVLEGLASGANLERAKELVDKWKLTIEDVTTMIFNLEPDETIRKGMDIYIEKILCMKEEDFWEKVLSFLPKGGDEEEKQQEVE